MQDQNYLREFNVFRVLRICVRQTYDGVSETERLNFGWARIVHLSPLRPSPLLYLTRLGTLRSLIAL
jgi:hypothetical protein